MTVSDFDLDGFSNSLLFSSRSTFIALLPVDTEAIWVVIGTGSCIFLKINVSGELGVSDEDDFREEFRTLNFLIFRCKNNCLRGKLEI